MNRFFGIVIFLFSTNIFAAYPNLEGLFRNSANKDIEGKSVQIKFSVKTIREVTSSDLSSEIQLPTAIEEVTEYYRMYFDLTYKGRVDLISIKYFNSSYNKDAVEDVQYIKDIYKRLNSLEDLEILAFYSQILFFALNDSYGMEKILKSYGTDFVKDKERMNKDKKMLLLSYRNYLNKVNEDESLKEELKSPLNPEEETQKEKVREVLNAKTYDRNKQVSLVREGRKFFWKVDLSTVRALFTNRSHRLKFLEVDSTLGTYQVAYDQFVLMDGIHELPKKYMIKNIDNEKVIVDINDYSVRDEKNFPRLYKYFRDEKKNSTKPPQTTEVPARGFGFYYRL